MATPSRSRRDFAALEARRFQAARLFAKGESQGAVARALGVTPVTAHHWYHAWHANGRAGLKAAGRAGRKPKLEPKQLATIEQALRAGPRVYGFSTDLWTLPRVAAVIERLKRVRHHPGQRPRSEEHTSELQSPVHLVCRLLLEKKKKKKHTDIIMPQKQKK